jgi:YtkA-like protein
MITRFALSLLAVAPAAFAGACSSTSASTGAGQQGEQGSGDGGGTVGCSGQGDTYSANLVKPGVNGVYTFTLVQAVPAPPDLNGNVWTLKIADKNGASPDPAQIVVYPYMPLMGHASDQTPTVTPGSGGTFTATDIDLFMPGYWTITVKVTEPEDAGASAEAGVLLGTTPLIVDQAVYAFCIN